MTHRLVMGFQVYSRASPLSRGPALLVLQCSGIYLLGCNLVFTCLAVIRYFLVYNIGPRELEK
jgi:hypothetical protein